MPQKCETISYCSPTPYRDPRKRASNLQHIWRFTTMHLKPYPKPQDKELHKDGGQTGRRNLLMGQRVLGTEWGVRQACSPLHLPGNGTVNRCPLSVITNTFCCPTNINSTPPTKANGDCSSSWNHNSKTPSSVTTFTSSLVLLSPSTDLENEDSLKIIQGEDEEGSLDIWAVIKPGNTKEKIALFTAQRSSHAGAGSSDEDSERGGITLDLRMASMKSKGCWDGDWSVEKRRKRSGNPDKSKCITPTVQKLEFSPATLNPNKRISAAVGEIMKTNEEDEKMPSVVEMVAYLEQRSSDQQVDLKRSSLRSSSTVSLSKGVSLLQPAEQPDLPEGQEEEEEESVRVLDMVAKLESQCLSRQSIKEGGVLSRSNSLRRRVGRVLLAGSEPYSVLLPPALPSLFKVKRINSDPEKQAGNEDETKALSEACKPVQSGQPECFVNSGNHQEDRNVTIQDTHPEVDALKGPCTTTNRTCEDVQKCSEPPPGMLFFAQPSPQALQEQTNFFKHSFTSEATEAYLNSQKNEHTGSLPLDQTLGSSSAVESFSNKNMDKLRVNHDDEKTADKDMSVVCRGPVPLRRLVSLEFLETRFKIQLLLEPQQYMAFLPHHIIVKIFSLLPTESLAALKCTCQYFKFIIESYGVRPADSRWVSDPRYKDDPCKQCKRRYDRGDVSLCRWHHKPYCQALPYGPGYWMCCRGAHKDTPGCNVGLHDNRWVPAFHSISMPIYRKSRDREDSV
ncbi:F-box only protein 34 [Trichomycterus rosablanca]|uniref:F-box only protein 34 n=1 Tax=Trichomycterus rosablanca TaxID=2290929 RepID=UPI002F357230